MMVLMKYSRELLSLLVLLSTIRESLMGEDDHPSNDFTSTFDPNAIQTNDPNLTSENQSTSPKPGKFSNFKEKFTPNREKWRQRKQKFVDVFKIKPAEQTDTLKSAKNVLLTFQMLMDKKIFNNCANPMSYRINHFDVKNHIFTKEYIKVDPYDEKFMNIYGKFLNECCHPLLDLYKQRLKDDQVEANKRGNRMYKFEELPDQHPQSLTQDDEDISPEEPSEPLSKAENSSETSDHSEPSKKQVTFANPLVTEQTTPQVKKRNSWMSNSGKAGGHYSNRASWFTGKLPAMPFTSGNKEAKVVASGGNNQLVKRKLKKGPFQPQPLTYWQKAFIYRAINWASSFLIEPKYIPSIKLKEKLAEIMNKYSMNLLDPKFCNLEPSMIAFDCIPVRPIDLENCCEDKDKSIEHFYHLGDVYNKQKEKEELEKRKRKSLGLKKEKKKKKIDKKTLSEAAIFRLKMENDTDKYGFYPVEPNKQVALQVVNAFLPEKFQEIFSINPNTAKKIIKKRYKIRKYQERAQQLGIKINGNKLESKAETEMGIQETFGVAPPAAPPVIVQDTNTYFNAPKKTAEVPPPAEDHIVKQENSESFWSKYITKNFYAAVNAFTGALTDGCSGKKKNQSTPTNSEHLEDGLVQSPNAHHSSSNTNNQL